MYTVIGSRKTRAFRVLWILEEMGLDYDHVPCLPQDEIARAAHPSGKLPSLKTEARVLTDSVAIMTYLADAHGQLSQRVGTVERAVQDGLTLRILDEVDALLWCAARHSFVLPQDLRVPAIKDTLKWEYEGNLNALAGELQGSFLMGEALTLPDILLGHCLRWAEVAGFPAPPEGLAGYKARLEARPALQRVLQAP